MKKKYRVGVIGRTGHGDYGHHLDRVWLDVPETEIVAVADDNKMGLGQAGKRLGVDALYPDYRRMLDEAKPDIAAVCPRWIDQHRDMAVAAAERGIHIFMEKPFCRTLEEADAVVDACERTHVKFALGHPTRYSPKFATLKKLIDQGAIGRVLQYRGRGKEDRRGGGEDLWVLGTHVMDMMLGLAGRPEWCFAHVTQDGKPVTNEHVAPGNEGVGPLAGDAVRAMYGLPDGSTFTFGSYRNTAGRPSRYGLQIYGSRGVFELLEGTMPSVKHLDDPGWSPGRSGAKWQDVSSAGIGKPEPLEGAEYKARYILAVRDFLAAIEENREPIDNVYDAHSVVEMIAAVFESHRLGSPAKLPLQTRKNPLTLL